MTLFTRRSFYLTPACLLAAMSCATGEAAEAVKIEALATGGDIVAKSPARPPPLSRIADIFKLPREVAARQLGVAVEGVVLCVRPNGSFFLHDGEMGIYVAMSADGEALEPGDQVRVIGLSRPGVYSPSITPSRIIRLGKGRLPEPREASYEVVASGSTDSQWLALEGVVWSVDLIGNGRYILLDLAMRGGRLRVLVSDPPPDLPGHLVDAEVRLHGVATGNFNPQGQLVSPLFRVPNLSLVKVTRPAMPDPFAGSLQPLDTLLGFSLEETRLHRVRVRGDVTRQISLTTFFIRDGNRSLRVDTHHPVRVQPGDTIEAVGFPAMQGKAAVIQSAAFRKMASGGLPRPVAPDPAGLLDGSHNSDLVSIQARLLDWTGEGSQLTLILQRGDQLFKGSLRQPDQAEFSLPEKNSLLEVTGVCGNGSANDGWFRSPPSFMLLIASPDDVRLLQRPPWWTPERLWSVVAVLLTVLLAGMGWVWSLRRQVRRKRSVIEEQARHAAVLEERSRIARDLHDSLEQGLTGVSLQLTAVETDLKGTDHPAQARLEQALRMLCQSRAISRDTIRELRSDTVPVQGEDLADGLHRTADLWNQSGAIAVKLNLDPVCHPLPPVVEQNLLGIMTEAVTNAVKHGAAGSVAVEFGPKGSGVVLRIKDDGRGFDLANTDRQRPDSYGLIGMHERARKIGGRLQIHSTPGQGTEIMVEVPIEGPAPTAQAGAAVEEVAPIRPTIWGERA